MKNKENFDVLTIVDNEELIDLIQTILGDICLGSSFHQSLTKLYFNIGSRETIGTKLAEYFSSKTFKYEWETLEKEDWHLDWKGFFNSIIIDDKLAIIPHWEKKLSVQYNIKIKPGMAFGTGHHETTWLMLNQMLTYVQPGMRVLDLGTGSGILSIAANKLGAIKIDSVDNDSECQNNYFENLKLNEINKGITFYNKDILTWTRMDFDLILANINRNIIEQLIPQFKNTTSIILLSGLLATDFDFIQDVINNNKLRVKEKLVKGEWICLTVISK